jgi:hypothetical protein
MTEGPHSVESVKTVAAVGRKRSRLGQTVPDETVLAYSAARAFLLGEWFGAAVLVASYTLLYLFALAPGRRSVLPGLIACLLLLALGAAIYLRSRTYYGRVAFDYAPKWHSAAIIVAGSAGVFWLLFAFLGVLTWFGVAILPN